MFGDVFKRSIAAISIKPVGKTGGLANIQVVESVAVDIAYRDAVVAIDIDAARTVENGTPVIHSVLHLCSVGQVVPQCFLRNIPIPRGCRPAARFTGWKPTPQTIFT